MERKEQHRLEKARQLAAVRNRTMERGKIIITIILEKEMMRIKIGGGGGGGEDDKRTAHEQHRYFLSRTLLIIPCSRPHSAKPLLPLLWSFPPRLLHPRSHSKHGLHRLQRVLRSRSA